jgi:enoyl-CoA hydratase/carnithine racemase
VVTGTPPAFCVGGDSQALAGHAERGGYDPGMPADAARPG